MQEMHWFSTGSNCLKVISHPELSVVGCWLDECIR